MDRKNEYLEINLKGLSEVLYRNIKLLISFIVLGSLVAVLIIFTWTHSRVQMFAYTQMIEIPSYSDGSSADLKPIVNLDDMNMILQMILSQQKQSDDNLLLKKTMLLYPNYKYDPSAMRQMNLKNSNDVFETSLLDKKNSNYMLKQLYDYQTKYFSLFVLAGKKDINSVSQVYAQILAKFSKSDLIKTKLSKWQKSVETKIQSDSSKLAEYKELLKQNNRVVSNKDQQASIVLNVKSNDALEKEVIKLEDSVYKNKQKLASANFDFSNYADMIVQPAINQGMSIKIVLLMAVFVVLFGSVVLTYLIDFLRRGGRKY
ncbi:hypothetical protein IBE48_09465 [Francisella philomiragia]|uniref:Chain length determinant family protein n=1 Tax=Francisella philomiragia TaxID=28110 RepID=A0AAW3DB37_9GAMM|nr:hypothetical protein [Francisella philomiragia]KFJ42884.1 hypothetical protein DR78_429 [Francisella philomiragia]MBK2255671.1 hypothetical protein [Francisella philomiragia]MBK2273990.1 hypothetical protein [Francisella philomiragia]MBK2277831.1 hypothetical protein [Francisella philomiragia]MBK2281777.1 hypothetical protein [Francisella philomiragia]